MKYFKLFANQEQCVDACLTHYRACDPRPAIAVAPTGYGKSIVIAEIAKRIGSGVVVLHLSKELLRQNCEKFSGYEIKYSVFSHSMNSKEIGSITFATLKSVKAVVPLLKANNVNTVIIDECDRNFSPKKGSEFMKFIEELAPRCVIGLTATPWTLTHNAVGETVIRMLPNIKNAYFKKFLYVCQIQEMIQESRWTPIKTMVKQFDGSSLVYTSDGASFTEESVVEANVANSVNRSIAYEIKRLLGEGYSRILVFVDSTTNAKVFSEWLDCGAVLTDATPAKERDEIVASFKAGVIKVLFNYSILSVGFDYPELEVVIMGKATNSLSLYYQIFGRLVRKAEGKLEGIFQDYCGNVDRFGRVEDIRVQYHADIGYYLESDGVMLSNVPLKEKLSVAEFLEQKNDSHLRESLNKNVKFTYGKYQGKSLMSIPAHYLVWWLGTKDQYTLSPSEMELYQEVSKVIRIKRRF